MNDQNQCIPELSLKTHENAKIATRNIYYRYMLKNTGKKWKGNKGVMCDGIKISDNLDFVDLILGDNVIPSDTFFKIGKETHAGARKTKDVELVMAPTNNRPPPHTNT